MFLIFHFICHFISQDHLIKGSGDFMVETPQREEALRAALVTRVYSNNSWKLHKNF